MAAFLTLADFIVEQFAVSFFKHVATAAWGLALCVACCSATGAEIRLRAEAIPQTALVRLADVASLFTADDAEQERLERIGLFPAPPVGQRRFITAREVEDALRLAGENLLEHTVSGASRVTVLGPRPLAEPKPISTAVVDRAKQRVREAIGERLLPGFGRQTAERIAVTVADRDADALAHATGQLVVAGKVMDQAGPQNVTIEFETREGPQKVQLAVAIEAPEMVVVATRSLARGATIREADVTLAATTQTRGGTQAGFVSLDSVLGMELTRPAVADRAITEVMIRRPRLVLRGDVVTVHSVGQGVRVTLDARAVEDGSMGDLIRVESLSDRTAFFARVNGMQQVEVYARGTSVPRTEVRAALPDMRRSSNLGASVPETEVRSARPNARRPSNQSRNGEHLRWGAR